MRCRPAPAPARQPLPTFQDLTSARLAETSEEQRNAAVGMTPRGMGSS
jgi:hypothetical protein